MNHLDEIAAPASPALSMSLHACGRRSQEVASWTSSS